MRIGATLDERPLLVRSYKAAVYQSFDKCQVSFCYEQLAELQDYVNSRNKLGGRFKVLQMAPTHRNPEITTGSLQQRR